MSKNPSQTHRSIFIVSDGTGITAETLADSILSQFDFQFVIKRFNFIDTHEKLQNVIQAINQANSQRSARPIVFHTFARSEFSSIINESSALHFDLMQDIVGVMENELGQKAVQTVGSRHKDPGDLAYRERIDAINFALQHDDGQSHQDLKSADVILIGVSRSGKTPTSLYLAMQYGIKVANYPLIPEDFERARLPSVLLEYKKKLFGLSIDPELLFKIRQERRPGSQYASIENCMHEVHAAEKMMQQYGVKWLSSTSQSIEEIASTIAHQINGRV